MFTKLITTPLFIGPDPTPIKNLSTIMAFLDDLLKALADHPHPIKVLGRMKEIWGYLGVGIDGSGGLTRRIMQCETIAEYQEQFHTLRSHTLPSPPNRV